MDDSSRRLWEVGVDCLEASYLGFLGNLEYLEYLEYLGFPRNHEGLVYLGPRSLERIGHNNV